MPKKQVKFSCLECSLFKMTKGTFFKQKNIIKICRRQCALYCVVLWEFRLRFLPTLKIKGQQPLLEWKKFDWLQFKIFILISYENKGSPILLEELFRPQKNSLLSNISRTSNTDRAMVHCFPIIYCQDCMILNENFQSFGSLRRNIWGQLWPNFKEEKLGLGCWEVVVLKNKILLWLRCERITSLGGTDDEVFNEIYS